MESSSAPPPDGGDDCDWDDAELGWGTYGGRFLEALEFTRAFYFFARDVHHHIPTDRIEPGGRRRLADLPGYHKRSGSRKVLRSAASMRVALARCWKQGCYYVDAPGFGDGVEWANNLFQLLVIKRWGWGNYLELTDAWHVEVDQVGYDGPISKKRRAEEHRIRLGDQTIDPDSLRALSEAVWTLRRACQGLISIIGDPWAFDGPHQGVSVKAILEGPIAAPSPKAARKIQARQRGTLTSKPADSANLIGRRPPRGGLGPDTSDDRARSLIASIVNLRNAVASALEEVSADSTGAVLGYHLMALIGVSADLRSEMLRWMPAGRPGLGPMPAMMMTAFVGLISAFDRLSQRCGWPSPVQNKGDDWDDRVLKRYARNGLVSLKAPDGSVSVQEVEGHARFQGTPTDPFAARAGMVSIVRSLGPPLPADSESLTPDMREIASCLHGPDAAPGTQFGMLVGLKEFPRLLPEDVEALDRIIYRFQSALPGCEFPAILPFRVTERRLDPPTSPGPVASADTSREEEADNPGVRALNMAVAMKNRGEKLSVAGVCKRAGVDRKNIAKRYPDAVRAIHALATPDHAPARGMRDRRTGNLEALDGGR